MYCLPLNLTSSGEKVALTQAVERHLPTYASLALDSRVGVKNMQELESNENASCENTIQDSFVR